jgi:hypothetical protein
MRKLICAALICAAPAAQAEFWEGNKLYRYLSEPAGFNNGAALGFVIGVHDLGEGVLHCSPSNITAGQAKDVVIMYLNEFPSLRHNAAHTLVTRAFQRVWPCAAKGNPT